MLPDINKKARWGAVYVLVGYGGSQVLRLGGNLVLTRLLVPEMFGVMALANVFILGLNFFSDIGLGPGIIRSPRAKDSVFLNTAWTMQVIRGGILWFAVLCIAYPVAQFYEEPLLFQILPVIGFGTFLNGCSSTSIYTLTKDMKLNILTYFEIMSQIAGLIVMVVLAYFYRSLWSLVIGGVFSTIIKTVWSHYLEPEDQNRFCFEKESVMELFHFGKWIFFSTAMMFLATQADRLMLGKLFPLSLLGVYGIAVMFAELPKQVITRLSSKIIFPLISQYSHLSREELREKILQKRLFLLVGLMLLVGVLTGFGDFLVTILYDVRYHAAGWMLPILALGIWPLILIVTMDGSLYVVGKPKYPAIGNLVKFVYMIVFLPLGFRFFGVVGAVVVVALNDLPLYLVVNYGLKREGLSGMRQDAVTTMLLLLLIFLIILFRLWLDVGYPGEIQYFMETLGPVNR